MDDGDIRESLGASYTALTGTTTGETSEEEDRWLAEMWATSWECALRRQYPDRAFEVEVLEPEDGLEVCVCVYQCR